MARPKKDVKSLKAIIVSFRLNVDGYLELASNAETLGLTIPQFIRKKISGSALPRMRYSPIDRKVYVELSRIGNNINQLTKQAHLGMRNPIYLDGQLNELKHLLNGLKSNILNNDSKAD
ncbi:plasmid mobilization protein [Flagellimonas meridianipacifica]|uniref:Mobilization protein MobC n=1 Tax=Flagellimonas meridianipacifica TaxID=1080225 RepID=A0A2T0MFC2_9FLAO|nr:plasmid mobilization relaxosome protein MobC [Allomuricauda pacifica]PRX56236.1 mobilization protein MobC [Allomuricauda pacifica]